MFVSEKWRRKKNETIIYCFFLFYCLLYVSCHLCSGVPETGLIYTSYIQIISLILFLMLWYATISHIQFQQL